MGITTRPQDKYAFLFTGPTAEGRFIIDIENVFHVLTEYYNYPVGNIWVVRGSSDASPNVPGVTVITVSSVSNLETQLNNFASTAFGPAPGVPAPDNWKTAFLYFTGGGIKDGSISKLVTDGGLGAVSVDPTWLQARLNNFSQCHINVMMQQAYAGGFQSALTGSSLTQWSFTYACSDTQDSYGNGTLGSFFTNYWVRGLKEETLPAGTPDAGKYADTLGSAAESTNYLISMAEAMNFGKQIHDSLGYGAFSTPGCVETGGPQYPGKPSFLIRDGSPWYESPDIYLTYPNHPYLPPGDLYITDPATPSSPYNNTINVKVRNVGTHPVRAYSLAVELFKTGACGTSDQHTELNHVPAGGLLLPIDMIDIAPLTDRKDTYPWNVLFQATCSHRCVKAEAKLLPPVDFIWQVVANDFEGQRNIDEMTIVPPPPTPPPLPLRPFKGFMKHVYGIKNTFDSLRRFYVVIPEIYREYREVIKLEWYLMAADRRSEPIPLEVAGDEVQYIPLTLKSGEERDILLHTRLTPGFNVEEAVELPFEIIVLGDWPDNARRLTNVVGEVLPGYASIAGFTVKIKTGSTTLKGKVKDEDNKPLGGARIFVNTVNLLQGTMITTDKKGNFELKDINPGVYRLRAEAGELQSQEQILLLSSGKEEKLELPVGQPGIGGERMKVILDRICIMNDHDPCIKGKGELTFTAVVVPDNDDSRKQVTRLPAKGVYRVSDKPGKNDINLSVTLFDGFIRNRSLSITISGKEIDFFAPDDRLNRYHREFAGDPQTWCGQYSPTDEYLDREDVKDWALWYRVIREK